MTIRLRLACLFTAATLLLLIGGGFLFVTGLESGLETSLDQALASRAAAISAQARSPQPDGAAAGGRRIPPLTSANGITAQLLARDGTVLRASRTLGSSPLISPSQVASASRHSLILDATVTLRQDKDSGPEPMRLFARPSGHAGTVVVVAISRDVVDQAVSRAARQLVILSIVVLILVGPGSWVLTRAALHPVERMRRVVSRLQAGDASAELPVPKTRDEIARLAQTFNGLLGRLHDAVARERAFVGDAGHELRTPLTILKGEIELGRRPGRSLEELTETLEVVGEETDRLVRLTEDMLFLTVQTDSDLVDGEVYDLVTVVRSAVQAVSPAARAPKVEIVVDVPVSVPAIGSPDRIRRAIENLLTNAIRFSAPGGTVTVAIGVDGAELAVRVTDQGPGFPPDFIDHAFDRFARADSARARLSGHHDQLGGSGLGLAIVRAIMIRHRGSATATNNPDRGACVTLRWPSGCGVT
ncbi:MAG: ATP-binding protein, partial [Actinomycetota bacterium]|nr:ATP-binding protein [Actinomycetota bacterium]